MIRAMHLGIVRGAHVRELVTHRVERERQPDLGAQAQDELTIVRLGRRPVYARARVDRHVPFPAPRIFDVLDESLLAGRQRVLEGPELGHQEVCLVLHVRHQLLLVRGHGAAKRLVGGPFELRDAFDVVRPSLDVRQQVGLDLVHYIAVGAVLDVVWVQDGLGNRPGKLILGSGKTLAPSSASGEDESDDRYYDQNPQNDRWRVRHLILPY